MAYTEQRDRLSAQPSLDGRKRERGKGGREKIHT